MEGRKETKIGVGWGGHGREQKHLEKKQRDTHKNILTNFSELEKPPKQTIKDDHAIC